MKQVCVYCGSSAGNNPLYQQAAIELGNALLQRQIGLVYGGASIGIMGTIADSVLNGGGSVTGVIPGSLAKKEVLHEDLTQLHIVGSMHERKATMARHADGFIALAGGLGTLEELFEILTWSQLGMHNKPVALLNTAGFYDKLLAFLADTVEANFIRPEHMGMLLVANDPETLLDKMESFQPRDNEPVMTITET